MRTRDESSTNGTRRRDSASAGGRAGMGSAERRAGIGAGIVVADEATTCFGVLGAERWRMSACCAATALCGGARRASTGGVLEADGSCRIGSSRATVGLGAACRTSSAGTG